MSDEPAKKGEKEEEPEPVSAGRTPAEENAEIRAANPSSKTGETQDYNEATDRKAGTLVPGEPAIGSEATEAETSLIEENEIAFGAGERSEVLTTRKGMFGVRGSGDTSGYGGLNRIIEFPAASERPYGGWYDQIADRIGQVVPNAGEVITRVVVFRGEITFHVARAHLATLARTLRDDPHLRFEFCSSVSGVHYPADIGAELHSVYHLQSMTHNRRIRLEVSAPDADPHMPSVVATYPTADWHERESYDMFGIIYDGHPALTRILMPDDWPGHPQRKDYPLGGIPIEYKGATIAPPDQRRSYS